MKSVRFDELFDGLDGDMPGFSATAQALSGEEVEVRGYLSPLHEDGRYALVAAAGGCPDCGPVAAIHLPDFRAGEPRPDGAIAVRLRGRLDYGFAIAADGYASFLRLAGARLATGIS